MSIAALFRWRLRARSAEECRSDNQAGGAQVKDRLQVLLQNAFRFALRFAPPRIGRSPGSTDVRHRLRHIRLPLSLTAEIHPLLAQFDIARIHHLRDDVCSVLKLVRDQIRLAVSHLVNRELLRRVWS